jgi:hypothetical protein
MIVVSTDDNYAPNTNGKCPHCGHQASFKKPDCSTIDDDGQITSQYILTNNTVIEANSNFVVKGGGDSIIVYSSLCPNRECQKPIVTIKIESQKPPMYRLVYPPNIASIVPPEVPEAIKTDFQEASLVLAFSERASAALSRRCLENMLNEKGYEGNNLYEKIGNVLKDLPPELVKNVDYIPDFLAGFIH